MNRALAILLLIFILVTSVSCLQPEYRDDLSATELADMAISALPKDVVYVTDESSHTDAYFKAPDYLKDHSVRYAEDTNNINELGIYRVEDGYGEELAELLRGYLTESYMENVEWYDSYIPRETPKLRDAEVHVYGDTVVYVILHETDKRTVLQAIEAALVK